MPETSVHVLDKKNEKWLTDFKWKSYDGGLFSTASMALRVYTRWSGKSKPLRKPLYVSLQLLKYFYQLRHKRLTAWFKTVHSPDVCTNSTF